VHGDLTFENVMVDRDCAIKFIDMESQESFEAPELDLGKMFQSTHSRYEEWSKLGGPLCNADKSGLRLAFSPKTADADLCDLVQRRWSTILGCSREAVLLKGRFYLGLHLVRMVPFRMKQSMDQAQYALATALQYIALAVKDAASRDAVPRTRAA
jgi:hypothetical protein